MKDKVEKVDVYYDKSTQHLLAQLDNLGLEIEKIEA